MAAPIYSPTTAEVTAPAGFFMNFKRELSGGTPTSWSFSGLPPGWSGNTSTGFITGICNTPGLYTYYTTATNIDGSALLTTQATITASSGVPVANAGPNLSVEAGQSVTIAPSYSGGTPSSWAWTGLPTGLTADTGTGIVTGSVATAGSYTLTVAATNSSGTGPSDSLMLTVTDVYAGYSGPTASLVDLFIEMTTGAVTRTPGGSPGDGPVLSHKFGDDKLLNIVFTRRGVVAAPVLTELRLAIKATEAEPPLVTFGGTEDDDRWHDVGEDETTAFRFYYQLAGTALAAAVADAETATETRLEALAEIEWIEENEYTPTVGPETLRGSSANFRYDITRDFIP